MVVSSMVGLEVGGDRLAAPRQSALSWPRIASGVRRRQAAIRAHHAAQQRAGEGRIAEQADRRRIAGRAARDQAAAVERAGEPGEQHPLVELGRRALRALLVEIGDADEGGDRPVIVVGQPEFLAGLLPALVGRGGDRRQRDAVGVEDLDRRRTRDRR